MTHSDTIAPEAASRKIAAAKASIAASAFLAVAKLVVGVWSGSLALLSEAGHAAVDTVATILTYYAVREAHKPADEEHHYGHGKFESLAALVETGFLFGLALFVVGEAIRRLGEPHVEIDAGWPAFAVLIVSMVIDFGRSTQLSRIAKEEGSEALAADALHFSSDLVSSGLALIGLAAARLGYEQGDSLAAFGVSLFIAIAGYRLGKRTIDTLLDAAPAELAPQIEDAIRETPGVIAVEGLRLRAVGHQAIGDVTIAVARNLSVEQAAHIKEAATAAIAAAAPQAQVTVNAEPRALDDETVIERILLVAARRHLPVHRIVTQMLGERLSISVDIEVDGAMPHGRAHAIASDFERAVREEFGDATEIETHIDPLAPHVLSGKDAEPAQRDAIAASLGRNIASVGVVSGLHDLRVRDSAGALIVNYHCAVDAALPVEVVHEAVDEVERRVREEFPQILRITGHAEPLER